MFQTGLQFLEIAGDLIGITQEWEDLNPAERAIALQETFTTITDAIDEAKDAWDRFKKGTSRPVESNLDSASLNQSVQKKVRGNPKALSDMSDKVSGKKGSMSTNVGDRLRESGPPGSGNRKESWNQPAGQTPPGASPGGKKKARKFLKTDQLLSGLDAILGVVTTIEMAFRSVYYAPWQPRKGIGSSS